MAVINTNEDFALAALWWTSHHTAIGQFQTVPSERKIYDQSPGLPPVDVTPPQQVLEAALDSQLAANQVEALTLAADAAILEAKAYIKALLDDITPPTLEQIVEVIKPRIDANPILVRRMTRQFQLKVASSGWVVNLAPGNDVLRGRYIDVFEMVVSVST